jgi:hypothetical protein
VTFARTLAFCLVLVGCGGPVGTDGPWRGGDGVAVDDAYLWSFAGDSEHCDWGDVTFLFVGRDGAVPGIPDVFRGQFVRDPQDRFSDVAGPFGRDVRLPADAYDSGYSTPTADLLLARSTPDAVFIRIGDVVELWPRVTADEPILCA